MSGKSCFMFGHRTVPENLTNVLARAVDHHITEYGVTTFYVGHYGAFDAVAAAALAKAKEPRRALMAHTIRFWMKPCRGGWRSPAPTI